MNDHDAMEAVNAVLEHYFRGRFSPYEALNAIAQISGQNKNQHQESK